MGENVRDDLRWEPEELKPDAVDGEPGPESPPEFRKAALTEKPQTNHYSRNLCQTPKSMINAKHSQPMFCFAHQESRQPR